jgi:hypothetical protein
MRVEQIAGALTLSVALAAIGLITAAPASAAEEVREVTTRVKIQRVHSRTLTWVTWDGIPVPSRFRVGGVVKGVVRSRKEGCESHRRVRLVDDSGRRYRQPVSIPHPNRTGGRGRFELYPTLREEVAEASTFRVVAPRSFPREPPNGTRRFITRSFKCKADRSRWFTFPPPSEAGIAAAPASAAEEVNTRLKLDRLDLDPGVDRFYVSGRVRSSVKACKRPRFVNVIRPGGVRVAHPHGARRRLTDTDSKGHFSLSWRDENPPARYRFKVPRSFPEGRSLKCEADVKRIRVPN